MVSGKCIDICWLVKVRGHLDKVQKERQRIKEKKLSTLSSNSSVKKMVFERFYKHLPHFQFEFDFLSYRSSQRAEFENIYSLTTLNKTDKNQKKMNNPSETCKDESGLLEVLNTDDKANEKSNSTENLYNCENEGNVFKGNNIASQLGVRLEGKFLSKNVVNL